MRGESLFVFPKPDDTTCEVHDWTLDDFLTRFVPLLRERHGRGGLNCCRECLVRAAEAAKVRRETSHG